MPGTHKLSLWFLMLFLAFEGCTRGCSGPQNTVLNADRSFKFPPGFPPDPGAAGKKTLEGTDLDHDGLRDDVQRWIYARYPNDEKKRKALRLMALDLQRDSTQNYRYEEWEKILHSSNKALRCVTDTFPDYIESNVELNYLQAKVMNTPARISQANRNDNIFDGKFLGPGYPRDGTACD